MEATLEQLDAEAQELLAKEQEEQRAAEAAAAAAQVRRTYAYSSGVGRRAAIPSQGSVVDYALSAHRLPLCVGRGGA